MTEQSAPDETRIQITITNPGEADPVRQVFFVTSLPEIEIDGILAVFGAKLSGTEQRQ